MGKPGKPRKKKPFPPQLTPQIGPDVLFSPLLLKYVQTLRNEKYIDLAEKFDVPYTWDDFELPIIQLKIRELLKYGSFDKLAWLLRRDPRGMVHPVIMNQMHHLAKLSRGPEEGAFYPYNYSGPFLPEDTRLKARKALLTIFQGMWSAFSPSTILKMKPQKDRGRHPVWQVWEMAEFREDYNTLKTYLEELNAETEAARFPLRRSPQESQSAYLKRIIEVVRQLDSRSGYAHAGAKKRTGPNTGVDTIVESPLPSSTMRAIAQQAIRNRSVQKHILLAGMFAHYFYKDHTKWRRLDRVIQRAAAILH